MELRVDDRQLYLLIKQAVSEVLDDKLINQKLAALAFVDDDEMDEINSTISNPQLLSDDEFTDLEL